MGCFVVLIVMMDWDLDSDHYRINQTIILFMLQILTFCILILNF